MGEDTACTRHEEGAFAILSFGVVVRTIVSITLGRLIRRPVPEVPPLRDKKECVCATEESKKEIWITTTHEVFYYSTKMAMESHNVSGDRESIARRESMKKYEEKA